jgi:tocopherol O-methyltransferase
MGHERMSHEQKVREYYEKAGDCYQSIMGYSWHHGDPAAEARGASLDESRQLLEEEVVRWCRLKPGDRAMDFGAGVGGPMLHMAKVSGAFWTGLSNTDALNLKARALAVEVGLADKVSFLTTGDDDYKSLLAFADGSYDAVTFYESVCHIPDKAALFRAIFRILKPGGALVGIDWLQRPFGDNRTEEQIMRFMQPVNETWCIPWHGTVEGYKEMFEAAGFQVTVAKDLFEGVKCWGTTPTEERPAWLNYEGPEAAQFRAGKVALDAARDAGVFTVGMFVATKPG